MQPDENKQALLRSVALQNSKAVLLARERVERDLIRAKEALEESNRRMTLVLDSITDGFMALDRDWRFTFVNRRGEEVMRPLGKPPQKILETSLWEAFPDIIGTAFEENYRYAVREQVTVQFEIFYPRLEAWFDVRAYPSSEGLSIYFQDITERKRAQDALRHQHEWFAVTLASIGDAVITTDTTGHVTYLNPVAEAMTAWKTSEAAGQPLGAVFTVVNEQDRLPATSPVREILRGGRTVALADHIALMARNGNWTMIKGSAAPIIDATGNIAGVVMIFHDVTEQRMAEEKLRDSENRKSAILSAALDAIVTMDHEGTVVDFNPAAERIFGYAASEVIGKKMAELIIPERFRQRHYAGLNRYLASGEGRMLGKRIEMAACRADGSEFPSELSISRITGIEPPTFTATLRDITERKRIEEALRESEERFRATFNQAAVGIAIAALDGHFLEANQKFTEITGYSLEEIQQRTFSDITHPEDLALTQERVAELRRGQIPELVYEKRYLRKDGVPVWSLTTVTLLKDAEGNPRQYIGVIEEISQRKQAEEALRESERKLAEANADLDQRVQERTASLQQAMAQMEEFSYSVSHDLRAPIRAIEAYTQYIRSDYAAQLPPEACNFLQRISGNTARMNRLIDDVLTLSRMSRNEARIQPVALQPLIAEIIEQHPQMQPPNARIEVWAETKVMGDDVSLSQAISNLLTNAIKFVAPGLEPRVKIMAEPRGDKLRLWVEDNGIGIKPEHQAKLFSIFQRLHVNPNYEGTGVGLAIVKKAVERMGGTVGVESDGSTGSRFWIELKRAPMEVLAS